MDVLEALNASDSEKLDQVHQLSVFADAMKIIAVCAGLRSVAWIDINLPWKVPESLRDILGCKEVRHGKLAFCSVYNLKRMTQAEHDRLIERYKAVETLSRPTRQKIRKDVGAALGYLRPACNGGASLRRLYSMPGTNVVEVPEACAQTVSLDAQLAPDIAREHEAYRRVFANFDVIVHYGLSVG